MSRTYVEKRSVAEQIGIDAGMAVLGLALGAGLLSWFEGWSIPPVNDVLAIGVVGILFVFGLRLVWPLAPDVIVFSLHPAALVGWLLYYTVKIGVAPIVGIVAFPYAIIRDIVLVVREHRERRSAPASPDPGAPADAV